MIPFYVTIPDNDNFIINVIHPPAFTLPLTPFYEPSGLHQSTFCPLQLWDDYKPGVTGVVMAQQLFSCTLITLRCFKD